MKMCSEVESKNEYDRMHLQLSDFLRNDKTMEDLGKECVSAMVLFSESLVDKELYLANYIRLNITNCMDSETTSPVESQNSVLHQKLGINSNFDTHKSIKLLAENSQRTIADHHKNAIVSLNLTNKSSKSPTREYIIAKSQAIADQNFDTRDNFCVAQLSDTIWWCWNFDPVMEPPKIDQDWPSSALPKFVRVRTLDLRNTNDLHFVQCDCGFYNRIGIPCVHMFALVGQMSCNMFHIRHFKMYNALYADGSQIGQMLLNAQVRQVSRKI